MAKKLGIWRSPKSKNQREAEKNSSPIALSRDLDDNLNDIRNILGQSSDVIIHKMKIGSHGTLDAAIIYIDGLVERNLVNQDLLRPLMFHMQMVENEPERNHSRLLEFIQTSVLTAGDVGPLKDITSVTSAVLAGNTAILVEGETEALGINLRGWENRSLEEAKNESAIRGSRVGFNETLRTNTALLRRIIRDPGLTFDSVKIGQRTKTDVNIAYIKGITKDSLIEEVKQRLKRIDTDAILDVGYIEQFIEDKPSSFFSTIGNTERPDVAAARIMEGRAAILVDGSPFALTVPMVFIEGFQSPEDYYARPYFASLIRWIRFLSFELSIYLPAVYVALMAYHQELFPTPLLITVAASREGIPFPAVAEALFMVVLFEILREAGLRMPRTLGQAVSIVGALVIGQAAVSAGLVGAPMVVVLATTAIASFVSPSQADLGAILRFIMVIVAGFLGMFGIVIVSLELISQLAALRSFGIPYLSPITPLNIGDLKDVFIRTPLWAMKNRPQSIGSANSVRQASGQQPGPDGGEKR
ncbi:MAG TPA: spore germination protein [Syntrophomonadaceae bacterium]|nr:spore germination protein [Syntrophomonadaceae bacterium]